MVPSPVLFCMLSKVADSTYFMLPLYVCCLIPVFSFHSGFFWVANARFRSFKHLPKELILYYILFIIVFSLHFHGPSAVF